MIVKKVPRLISWILVGVLLLMPIWPFVSTWVGSLGGLEFWKSLPTIILVFTAILAVIFLVFDRKLLRKIVRDRLIILIIIFAGVVLVSSPLTDASARAKLVGLAMDLRYLLAFVLAFIAVKADPHFWHEILRKLPNFAIAIGVGLSIVGLIQVLLLPADFLAHFGYGAGTIAPSVSIDNTDVLRAFATLRGPNDFAAFLIIPLIFAILRFMKTKSGWYLAAGLIISVGIFASSSRSAWLGAVVAVLVMLAFQMPAKLWSSRKFWVSVAAVFAGLIIIGFALLQVPYVRLNVLHIDENRDSAIITSNDAHVDASLDAIDRVVNDPLGCGVGCAGPASFYGESPRIAENYYLQIAEQYGVIGVLLWAAIFATILYKLWKVKSDEARVWLAAAIGFAIIGLFLHVFADEPLAITWFLLAGMLIGGVKNGKSTNKKAA